MSPVRDPRQATRTESAGSDGDVGGVDRVPQVLVAVELVHCAGLRPAVPDRGQAARLKPAITDTGI